ncbi:PQ loop repeat protein [Xylona heveae TC161]|uniref:PQ loop repeat protein n=1 Tax=Xylona heveae (strain CBS 132557 / TC161) TaxID=1328760 RepID=A0A164ZNX9_XYLHT|nr:PQ loop repeat protein [Xylona heveae TC161]KZF19326.1 PQ loop repeat protein [Xylona heveae TC161]
MVLKKSHCDELASPSYVNLTLSILILLGILISYLPQHYRIIARRSSEGISPFFVLLGTTSGTCGFANILVLPASRADLACCKEVSGFACFAGLLGIAQVGVQWLCFTIILLLFLLFFPRTSPLRPISSDPALRTALGVVVICFIHILVTFFISTFILYLHPSLLQTWANVLGICSTLLASIQYIPQLWMTWHLKHVGSLSIPMMCIQTPGSFVWAGSLAARLGAQGWSTWVVYFVTGALQGCLLVMAIIFEIRDRRERKRKASAVGGFDGGAGGHETDDEGHHQVEGDGSNEQTPLLR